ncbi:MAG: SH3 domain-containing protein [Anaerolineae bacterium]|nr:SH3 domain-containing protein [Anaerolineae bacterium]
MIRGDLGSSSGGQWFNVWVIAGVVILVLFGIGIVVGGVLLTRDRQPEAEATQLVPTSPPVSIVPTVSAPTFTPLPTATPLPEATSQPATDVPPTEIAPSAMIEAGEGGVNVRSGPGTNFEAIGRLEPGEKAAVTGKYADWWQIDYSGALGWVAGWVVTAYDTDGVAEVKPPASPVPPTVGPATAVPPTKTSAPAPAAAECRGLVADAFQVEGAPGPYSRGDLGAEIRFHMWITNKTNADIEYYSLGVTVEETGQYQNSYSYSQIYANKQFYHSDHIFIKEPGLYNLWLTIGFTESEWCRLMGPVPVTVK